MTKLSCRLSAIAIFVSSITFTFIGIVAAHSDDGHTPNEHAQNHLHHHHHGHRHQQHQHRELTVIRTCGTPDPTDKETARAEAAIQKWKDEAPISASSDIEVQTYVHIIHPDGSDPSENEVYGNVQAQLDVLDAAFPGYKFMLIDTTVTGNDDWWNARPGSNEQTAMKNDLRQGDSATLNIYYNSPLNQDGGPGLLGYATFPWEYDDVPKDDGVGEQ